MEKTRIQRRLEATEGQIDLFEQCIANAKQRESEMPSCVYDAMVAGYKSQVDDLRADAKEYRTELGLD